MGKQPIVWAREGWGFSTTPLILFGKGPKWTILCGACNRLFKARLHLLWDYPLVCCVHCLTTNCLNVTWGKQGEPLKKASYISRLQFQWRMKKTVRRGRQLISRLLFRWRMKRFIRKGRRLIKRYEQEEKDHAV
jgi:hypothetical protein